MRIQKAQNIIEIKYKSEKPEIAYGVVKDIIDNYKIVYEKLNVQKSEKDTKFLEKEYSSEKAALNKKIYSFKNIQNSAEASACNLSILSYFDKRINGSMHRSNDSAVDSKKLQVEIDEDTKKLELLDSQYEQSKLINKISKSAEKIVVLQKPIKPRDFEYVEPKLKINLILGIILSFIFSFFVIIAERIHR